MDVETVQAITNSRFDIMRQYRKRVMEPVLRQQKSLMDDEIRPRYRKLKRLLSREVSLIHPREKETLDSVLERHEMLKLIYDKSHELQALWRQRGLKPQDKLQALMDWCKEAETSGIRYWKSLRRTCGPIHCARWPDWPQMQKAGRDSPPSGFFVADQLVLVGFRRHPV